MPVDTKDLHTIADKLINDKQFTEPMFKVVNVAADNMLNHIKKEAPYKTGKLANATTTTVTNDLDVTFTTSLQKAPYANFVYNGTKAHEISVGKGRVLSFISGGVPIFTKHVKIPAIPANPYIIKPWDKYKHEFTETLEIGAEITIQKELQL